MTRIVLAALLSALTSFSALADTLNSEQEAKKAVLSYLDSAKFGEFTHFSEKFACLTVHPRNSMGDYTDSRLASLRKGGNGWEVTEITELSHSMCVSIAKMVWKEEPSKTEKSNPSSEKIESDAKKAVLSYLNSAEFGEFTHINEKAACLTVKPRNSMGGYADDKQVVLIKGKNGWEVSRIYTDNHFLCVSINKV
jgi:hypothetical protein